MKNIHYIIIFFCLLMVPGAKILSNEVPDNTALLETLDGKVKERQRFYIEKENCMKTLRNKLKQASSEQERFDIYSRLYNACIAYKTDSAVEYIKKQSELLSVMADEFYQYEVSFNWVNIMILAGMYKEASDILEQVPSERLSGDLKKKYFQRYRTLYGYMADHAITEEEKNKYLDFTDLYRDSLLAILPHSGTDYIITKADQLNIHGKYDEAIRLIKTATDTCTNIEKKRFLAYTLSKSYHKKGDTENRKRYLILSAIADLEYAVKEYISLKELSSLLYEEGDINRAYEYMKCSLEDALSCNARSRTIEVAEILPVIDKAYRIKNKKKQTLISFLFIIMSFLLIGLIVAVIYVCNQMKKLAATRKVLTETNKTLQALNHTLVETNTIKEEYIAQYINRCSIYIEKMDKYRRKLDKFASTSRMRELFDAIKSEDFIGQERKEFYKEFDYTFLRLFPDFVNSFNALLNEKDQIHPKRGKQLNTELRIFALIRLGITDSTQIAEFLQYSVTTIYNYRSKIRNKAAADKNKFEEKVMKIK